MKQLAAITLVVAGILSGCGGDAPTALERLDESPAEFVREALIEDAIPVDDVYCIVEKLEEELSAEDFRLAAETLDDSGETDTATEDLSEEVRAAMDDIIRECYLP